MLDTPTIPRTVRVIEEPIGRRMPWFEIDDKFNPLMELGDVVAPDDYDSTAPLTWFVKRNREKLEHLFDENLSDAHFPSPSRVLKPGNQLRVFVVGPIHPGPTTTEEYLDFLAARKKAKIVHVGVPGLMLIYEQMEHKLPRGFRYISLDARERLWKNPDGRHMAPHLFAQSDGDTSIGLKPLEMTLYNDLFLYFCEVAL